MYYEEKLCKKYVGKKVTANLFDMTSSDFEWEGTYSDADEDLPEGTGYLTLDYRPYLSEDDDDPEDNEEDKDSSEFEMEEYDEKSNWSIRTGIIISVNDSGDIDDITITADVFCYGDSGLGECDPEEEWTNHDLALAEEFLESITSKE